MNHSEISYRTPATLELETLFVRLGTSLQSLNQLVVALTNDLIEKRGRPVQDEEAIDYINEREPHLLSILEICDYAHGIGHHRDRNGASFQASDDETLSIHGNSEPAEPAELTAKESTRRDVIRELNLGRITRTEAASHLGLTVRQLHLLRMRYMGHGDAGLIDRRRFTKGNSRKPDNVRAHVLNLIRQECAGLGPSAVWRKLTTEFGISLHLETVRLWMQRDGISTARRTYNVGPRMARANPPRHIVSVRRFHARAMPQRLRDGMSGSPSPAGQQLSHWTALRPLGDYDSIPVHRGILGAVEQICAQTDISIEQLAIRYLSSAIENPKDYFDPVPLPLSLMPRNAPPSAWTSINLPHQVYRSLADAVRGFDPNLAVADALNHVLWIIVRSFVGPQAVKIQDLLDPGTEFVVALAASRAGPRNKT